jgi:hypothetical protein
MTVSYYRGSRDVGFEDIEAGNGGEVGFEERSIGECDQGQGFQNLHG